MWNFLKRIWRFMTKIISNSFNVTPVYDGKDGKPGLPGPSGSNNATLFLYKRSSSAVTTVGITVSLYYKFSAKKIYTDAACTTVQTGTNGWSQTIPAGTAPLYVTSAVASNSIDIDEIGKNEWVTPAKFVENGATGDHGINTATIFLYKRSSSAISAHGITASLYYKFSDGKLYSDSDCTTEATSSVLNSWSRTVPSGSSPCYVIQAAALGNGNSDEIATTDWSGVTKLVENGANGDKGVSIALTLIRNNLYTDDNWNTWGEINYSGNYSKRSGDSSFSTCREGDYFIVTGTSSDSGKMHTVTYLCTAVSDNLITGKSVSHVKDGDDGKTGPMFYLCGQFPDKAPYSKDDYRCPVVYYDGEYWYLKADSATASDTPSASSTIWGKAEKFDMVFTDVLFVKNFAKLGSFIYNQDWFISQFGRFYRAYGDPGVDTSDEQYNNVYIYFHPTDVTNPGAAGYPCFKPHVAINAKTGDVYFNRANVNGVIKATTIYQGQQSPALNSTIDPANGALVMIPDADITAQSYLYLPLAANYPFVELTLYNYARSHTRMWDLPRICATGNEQIRIRTNRSGSYPSKNYCKGFDPYSGGIIKLYSIGNDWILDADETNMLFYD